MTINIPNQTNPTLEILARRAELALQQEIEQNETVAIEGFLLGVRLGGGGIENSFTLPNGELLLHYAVRKSSPAVIKLFLENSTITNASELDDQGLTLINHAYLRGDPEIQNLVLSHYLLQSIDSIKQHSLNLSESELKHFAKSIQSNALIALPDALPPLHEAVTRNREETIRRLLSENVDVNQQLATGETALHLAVQNGMLSTVKSLLEKGARTGIATNKGLLPLHLAALCDHAEMVNLLIQHKADPNAPDSLGFAPLHYALLAKTGAAFYTLLENSADPTVKNLQPSPLAFALSLVKQESLQKDPLKIDLMQTILCAITLASWAQNYYSGDPSTIFDIASSVLLSLSTASGLYNIYNHPQLPQFLRSCVNFSFYVSIASLALPFVGDIPGLSEISLYLTVVKVVCFATYTFKTTWRNRRLDPWRSLRNFGVCAVNTVSALPKIYRAFENIGTHYSAIGKEANKLLNHVAKPKKLPPETLWKTVLEKIGVNDPSKGSVKLTV